MGVTGVTGVAEARGLAAVRRPRPSRPQTTGAQRTERPRAGSRHGDSFAPCLRVRSSQSNEWPRGRARRATRSHQACACAALSRTSGRHVGLRRCHGSRRRRRRARDRPLPRERAPRCPRRRRGQPPRDSFAPGLRVRSAQSNEWRASPTWAGETTTIGVCPAQNDDCRGKAQRGLARRQLLASAQPRTARPAAAEPAVSYSPCSNANLSWASTALTR